ALGIAKLRIGLGIAVLVAADLGGLVALAQRPQHRLELGCYQAHPGSAVEFAQVREEGLPVAVEALAMGPGKVCKERADLILSPLTGLDLGEPRLLVLLLAGGEVRETALGVEAIYPIGCGLEVQAQGPLHRDPLETEVGVVEDLAHH